MITIDNTDLRPASALWYAHYKCVDCGRAFRLPVEAGAEPPMRPECRTTQPCQTNYRDELHHLMLLPAPYRPARRG